jgi:hypothetical protein
MIHPLAEECTQTCRSLTFAAAIASTRTLEDTIGNMVLSYVLFTTGNAVRIPTQTPQHLFSLKMTLPPTAS